MWHGRFVTLSTEKRPDQRVNVYLKNEYDAPLTAFTFGKCDIEREGSGEGPDVGSTAYLIPRDMLLEIPSDEGVPPGQVTEASADIDPKSALEMEIHAMVFADGAVAGNYEAINGILNARRKAQQDIATATKMLTSGASLEEFRAWSEAECKVDWESAVRMLTGGAIPAPLNPTVALRVIRLLEQGKTAREIVPLLNSLRDRLAQSKPVL
jgi:hypothetical protein